MKALSLAELLGLHARLIAATGGADGVRDLGSLEATIACQRQEVFGTVVYGTMYEKAAALSRGIIAGYPFIDGNKRTGLLAGMVFLAGNNEPFTARTGEIEDFAVKIATDRLDVDAVAEWYQRHCK